MRSRDLDPFLSQLRALPFVKGVKVDARDPRSDAIITLKTATQEVRYVVEVKASNLSRAVASQVIALANHSSETLLLCAHYIPPAIAEELAGAGVQFVDTMGNQHLQIAGRYFVHVTGKRPTEASLAENRSTQLTGFLVYFALVAEPELRGASIRTVAAAVGVSKSAVAHARSKLEREKLLVVRRSGEDWLDTQAVLDRWLVGYTEVVRPRLMVGGYRTQDTDPDQLEHHLERDMPKGLAWGYGGGAAAYRLTRHYRGETTVIHVMKPPSDLGRALRAVRSDQNPSLIVLRSAGPLLLQGSVPGIAHPLLVYSELLGTGNERAREAAAEVRERYLRERLA